MDRQQKQGEALRNLKPSLYLEGIEGQARGVPHKGQLRNIPTEARQGVSPMGPDERCPPIEA